MITHKAPGAQVPRCQIHAHVPESFVPAAVTKPEWAAYAEWVVSLVVFRRFIDKDADETSYVPLDSRFVEEFVPAKVRRPLLADLQHHGVLECDGLYYFGTYTNGRRGKCMCYRLGPNYRRTKVQARPVTHLWLLQNIEKARAKERAAVEDPVHLGLRVWHDRVEVTADAPHGEHTLLDRMLEGERRFTVCNQGRVHTNVANLPAQYRQYIRVDGRELESVDIATSQPLLLAVLLKKEQSKAKGKGRGDHTVLFRLGLDASLNVYLEDCLAGVVYDKVAVETGYSRDEVKPLFLAVIYGHPDHMGTKVGVAVRNLYPAVYEAVVEMNYRLGHGGLPRLMQTIESGVMIGRVAARLLREYPDVPLLTVHDSILVPAEHVGRVETVIAEEWGDEFGVVPRMKTSAFTAPQAARVRRKRRLQVSPQPSVRVDAAEAGGTHLAV